MQSAPLPNNELDRLLSLSEFDLDYTNLQDSFKDLTRLAAKVAGTDISLVNLIDAYTLWTISHHGLETYQTPRDESVCQYTITGSKPFEVPDFTIDDRFKNEGFVTDGPKLRYYYGVPLDNSGVNLGSLCLLDTKLRVITPEKAELLKIIADEIVNRLRAVQVINGLKTKLTEADQDKKKVAHDIRGPLGGIIGLARIISEQGHENEIDEVLDFVNMIHKSGHSILELADEILSSSEPRALKGDKLNLTQFKDKLEKLYGPQARNKNIGFQVNISPDKASTPFSKNKLMQIIGNLISNAMKFTPVDGRVIVDMDIVNQNEISKLLIKVTDTGIGLNQDSIDKIMSGNKASTSGTSGEQGYGFGLALVKHLVESLRGDMSITSQEGSGSTFHLNIPVGV
ncbi:MAG: GAF domain-containing sensor histidine kinase [Bacteroidota bacterium]